MNISGLKIQITLTIFILMTFALLIGNVVAVIFWQHEMVRSEAEHAGRILRGLQQMEKVSPSDIGSKGAVLDKACLLMGGSCRGSAIYDGNRFKGADFGELQTEAARTARNAMFLKEQNESLVGSMWGVFFSGNRYLIVASPWRSGGPGVGAAVMVLELSPIYETIRQDHKIIFIYILINICLLTFLGMYRMVNLIVRPIDRMIKITDEFQETDSLYFGSKSESSEFTRLNSALNGMLMRIEADKNRLRNTIESLEASNEDLVNAHKDIVRAEKLASVGRLSAGLAHEIGNPIGIVQGYIELLRQDDISDGDRKQYGQRALGELERVDRLVRQLLDYARLPKEEAGPVDIDEDLLGTVLDLATIEKNREAVEIEKRIEEGLTVKAEKNGLRQVLLNCLLNSFDALADRKNSDNSFIRVTAKRKADQIIISIADNGVGLDEKTLDKLFDPFYSTKEIGQGTGLGLYVSHSIIEASGGRMEVENNEYGGATARIILPMYAPESSDGE